MISQSIPCPATLITTKAEIVKDDYIEQICFDICKFLKLKGSICLQMKEDKNGNLKLISND